jgi:putative transposase
MKESDLLSRVKRRWVKTTDSRHRFFRYPDLTKGIIIRCLNQAWLLDITYIRIWTGFVYLAAILDAYSRKVIGYAVSISLDIALTLQALRMAIARRQPGPALSITPTRGCSMPQANILMSSRGTAFSSAWRAPATPTRMP